MQSQHHEAGIVIPAYALLSEGHDWFGYWPADIEDDLKRQRRLANHRRLLK